MLKCNSILEQQIINHFCHILKFSVLYHFITDKGAKHTDHPWQKKVTDELGDSLCVESHCGHHKETAKICSHSVCLRNTASKAAVLKGEKLAKDILLFNQGQR